MASIKDTVLDMTLGYYKDYGFTLKEDGDHTLELWHNGKRIARYNATKVTSEIIREGCRNYLRNLVARQE